jgi:urea transport system permease protein
MLLERLSRKLTGKSKARSEPEQVEARLAWGDRLGAIFSGISLGSILLLVALGLAITYGLMGVINMAHGELMMIGAYATYVVQGLFQKYLPGAFDWYLLASVPVAFGNVGPDGSCAGAQRDPLFVWPPAGDPAGHLGHQPDADATGAQLFGAQNVGVENPSWMSGGVQVLGNLSLPYNRLVIIGFAIAVLGVCLADQQNAPGSVCARRHAKPAHCQLHGREHRTH